MVWHIFRKDWKLLRWIAIGVAAINVADIALLYRARNFPTRDLLSQFIELLGVCGIFATACFIAVIVHQDAIPGVRQDWLVRPISRTALLLAKILFIVVTIDCPILVANLAQGLATGFGLWQSFGAACSETLYLFLAFHLPVLAFASVTSHFTEAVTGGLAIFLAIGGFEMAGNSFQGSFDPTRDTGLEWVTISERVVLFLFGGSAVLVLQYYRRKTVRARWLLAGVILACLFTQYLPWQSAFAIEKRVSPGSGAGNRISIAFDPTLGRLKNPSGVAPEERRWVREGDVFIYLPVEISKPPADTVLEADRTEIHLAGAGHTQDLGNWHGLEIFYEGPGDGIRRVHQGIRVAGQLYDRIKDQPLRLEIDYSFTLLSLNSAHTIPPLHGDERLPGAGWCKSQVNDSGTAVRVHCLAPGKPVYCGSAFLEDVSSGRRNPVQTGCDPDYSPYFGRYFPIDALRGAGFTLPFRDATGVAKYPVDGARLAQSRVVMRFYDATDHFTRQLVTPEIRLRDWQAE
jgi:hypothetical protein